MAKLLDKVDSPADLKLLTHDELKQLASEIREELVSTISINGGHLASNLGVVELTLSIHRIFNSPQDKIIWDVGHQAYTHKILTGRKNLFSTLRQDGGLSGYTSRKESEHDPFGAGHASTSISAGLGMAVARDLAGDDYHVVTIIGDGAITGGMALEAFNQIGHLGSKLIVILNDNGMSISPTVGTIAKLLSKVRFDQRYRWSKEKGTRLLSAMPLGAKLRWATLQIESSVKGLLMPTMLWEELGFTYMGPIDGHNIREVETALAHARDYRDKPTLVHVVTTKGKGYQPAEGDAIYFHGVASKNSNKKSVPTYSEMFAQTVLQLARKEPKLVVITPAMPEGNCLSIVEAEFPERVFDVGICEQHAVTFAAGLATQGYIPIVAIYSTFLQRAFDQIIHDVCLQDLPVIFAIDRSGIVGDDGKTHQGTFDISYMKLIPNLIVSAPKDENELQHLLYTAVKSPHPMAVRYPRSAGVGVKLDKKPSAIDIGKSEVLTNGEDIAILALGSMVVPALEAAQELASKNIDATVVNVRFAKPLDTELILDLASRIKRMVMVEENIVNGGFGIDVISLLKKSGRNDVQVRNIGLPDEFIEHGDQDVLRSRYALDTQGIIKKVLSMFPPVYSKSLSNVKNGLKNHIV
ncbi:1-deoxy-D-xylulose-5-phosphate synthase [Chloroflexota bacterium]